MMMSGLHCGAIDVRVVLLKITWVLKRISCVLHVVFHVPFPQFPEGRAGRQGVDSLAGRVRMA